MTRKRCKVPECRRLQKIKGYCEPCFEKYGKNGVKDHQEEKNEIILKEEPVNPIDCIVRATEIECLRFCKADSELRNTVLAMAVKERECKICEHEIQEFVSSRRQKIENLKKEIKAYKEQADRLSGEVNRVSTEIAEKYGLDLKTMTIDVDTGVLRDSSTSN